MVNWLIIFIAAIVVLFATYWLGEWVCRRTSARYSARRGIWRRFAANDPRGPGSVEG
jgi:hypothetical protein